MKLREVNKHVRKSGIVEEEETVLSFRRCSLFLHRMFSHLSIIIWKSCSNTSLFEAIGSRGRILVYPPLAKYNHLKKMNQTVEPSGKTDYWMYLIAAKKMKDKRLKGKKVWPAARAVKWMCVTPGNTPLPSLIHVLCQLTCQHSRNISSRLWIISLAAKQAVWAGLEADLRETKEHNKTPNTEARQRILDESKSVCH